MPDQTDMEKVGRELEELLKTGATSFEMGGWLFDNSALILASLRASAGEWLIWSNERGAYWGPNHSGYCAKVKNAGRYTFTDAKEICDSCCIRVHLNKQKVDLPPETMVPARIVEKLESRNRPALAQSKTPAPGKGE